jgi:BirA family biotin operon repressor/biotin-[acetyl-CoA-carboxylase] ligase
LLPIIFALLVAKMLENAMSPKRVPLGIKWPNDLYKDGKKVGGILLHLMSSKIKKTTNKIAVLGIGINIAWKDNNRFNASALYDCIESSKIFDVSNFFQELTTSIDNLDNDIILLNPTMEFHKRDILKKKYIKVAISKYQMVSGINHGIDIHGKLLIKEPTKSDVTKIDRGSIQWR